MSGVYISYPFCAQKCTYCNFASGVLPRSLEPAYLAAIQREINRHHWRWVPETVYIGGGTPSRLAVEDLKHLLAEIPGRPWAEATLEAAPGGLDAEIVRGWAEAGINRVSLGVQSFEQKEIARTGRKHTAEIVASEVALLREYGIANFNIDLIAGLSGQTRESWERSLDWVEKLEAPHVSVYMLEVDEDSRLGLEIIGQGSKYGAGEVPGDELTAEFYERAVDRLASIGIVRYEISNFARPGFESRHNLKYWRLEPYAGFGADAHSFDNGQRWQNVETAQLYVERVERGESPCEAITAANADEERFFVGLRLLEGIELEPRDWMRLGPRINELVEAGLLERAGTRLRLTPRGVLLSNEVFQEFLAV